MATILGSNITTVAALDAAIAQANAETTAGAYEIDLGANATIALTQALTAISLHSGVTLDIEGNDATINGESAQQGLVVQDGAVTVENLTIENAKAVGAAGVGGGGGGAGLGGGLFVGATGNVALTDVSFSNDSATGGAGGAGAGESSGPGSGSGGSSGNSGSSGQQHGGGGVGGSGILPVCIKAGALGDNVPRRDLWISPHHAMYFEELGGVLVEAKDLVNGVSIAQAAEVDKVEYFHVELETHDVIVAEGALSETFLDEGDSRGMFHNADEYSALYAEEPAGAAQYCAPRCDGGDELETVRRAIALRAGDAAVANAGALRGYVDGLSGGLVFGWAQNADHPEAPVCLDIFAEGRFVGHVLANRYREDLAQAGLGSGRHGFVFDPPAGVTFALETIEVRRSHDGAPVGGCGKPVAEPQAA